MFWGWKKEAKGAGHFLWHPQKAISRRFHSPHNCIKNCVGCVYAVILSGMKSWFHDHHHAIETMQSRVHDMSSLWRPSLCYRLVHIFSIFCYISLTTTAAADLKKTQNVRKVKLHTAYVTKLGTSRGKSQTLIISHTIPPQHTWNVPKWYRKGRCK